MATQSSAHRFFVETAGAVALILVRAVAALRRQRDVDESLLSHIAPLGWNHINLTGDYVWNANKRVAKGGFRSLRRQISPTKRS